MKNKYVSNNNEIIFNPRFNEPLDDYYEIIKAHSILKFSDDYSRNNPSSFNHPIYKLPNTLTCVFFGHSLNQHVNLSNSLVFVSFGCCFNYPIVFLPNNMIKRLSFSHYFNQPIVFPQKLIHLTLGYNFNQKVWLPETLEFLFVYCKNADFLTDELPNSLKELVIGLGVQITLNNLPNSVEQIVLCNSNTVDRTRYFDKKIKLLE